MVLVLKVKGLGVYVYEFGMRDSGSMYEMNFKEQGFRVKLIIIFHRHTDLGFRILGIG
jgi:hypothetical protein